MAPINIDIDIIINDNNNNFKQTSIAISAVHAHNLSSFLYNKFALSQSFSPIYVLFSLFSVGPDFGLTSHTRRYRLSFIIALAAPCPCRRPCITTILVLSLAPHWYSVAYARTCALHRHYSNCQWSPTTIQPTSSLPLPPGILSFLMFFLSANKAWKSNRCLNFIMYVIKVAIL